MGSVLLTVPSNQGRYFHMRLASWGGRPCPRSPQLPRSRGQLMEHRWVFPQLPALYAGPSRRYMAELLAKGGGRRKWIPPFGSYSATCSLRSHQGCPPRDREAGNPHALILWGWGAGRLLESLPGCVKRCSGGTKPPAAWPIHFRFGPYRE